jgi:hypothetical protein
MFPNLTTRLEFALLAGSPKIYNESTCTSSIIVISFCFIQTLGEDIDHNKQAQCACPTGDFSV